MTQLYEFLAFVGCGLALGTYLWIQFQLGPWIKKVDEKLKEKP